MENAEARREIMQSGARSDGWETLIEEGYQHYLSGDFSTAEVLYKAALACVGTQKVKASEDAGKLFFLLGDLCADRHEYPQAESYYRHALAEYENMNGDHIVDICVALKRISEVCRIQSKVRQASNLSMRSQRMLSAKRKQLEKTLQETA